MLIVDSSSLVSLYIIVLFFRIFLLPFFFNTKVFDFYFNLTLESCGVFNSLIFFYWYYAAIAASDSFLLFGVYIILLSILVLYKSFYEGLSFRNEALFVFFLFVRSFLMTMFLKFTCLFGCDGYSKLTSVSDFWFIKTSDSLIYATLLTVVLFLFLF